MKEDSIKSFGAAFQGFLKEEKLDKTYKQKQVIINWEDMMGKTISSRTEKMFFKGKTLFIKFVSAPLKQEMLNSKALLLQRIAEEIGEGEVDDIKFL